MKFTLSWLKEYLETDYNLNQICQKLTAIGLEVEEIQDQSDALKIFTVAQIIKAEPHPESDKLQICQVDVGDKENLQIICGAKNARSGLKVIYAPIGAVIPSNQMKIKKSKIRGVESCGMLCSAFELGIGKDGEGIFEVDDKIKIKTPITEIFGNNDPVIDINITPNRGDCLGVYGIARDLAAAEIGILKELKISNISGKFNSETLVKITSESEKYCPYFSGYYFKNISNKTSPKWLKERLEAIGVNSINAVVDVTNYVMYSLNQPLHAYDADKIKGNILVRNSKNGEEFISLKDVKYNLHGEELLICDSEKIVGLGGIIGSNATMALENSKNIFLEAAYFNPDNIAASGRKLNILSDARYRFERNIDIQNVKKALNMAASLILEICGGEISNIIEVGSDNFSVTEIIFDVHKIKEIANVEIAAEEIEKILATLGFIVKKLSPDQLHVKVPSFRPDITIDEDLVEEVIRIYGFEKIKTEPLIELKYQNPESTLNILRSKLCNSGLDEVINWSFIDSKIAPHFTKINPQLFIANFISEEMDYMRPSLVPGLITNIKKNQDRGFNNLALFEIGKIFSNSEIKGQNNSIAVVRVGKNKEKNHYKDERFFDVMDVKKDLFISLEVLEINSKSIQIITADSSEFHNLIPDYYHPYKSAIAKIGRNIIGYFGEIHPVINKKFDVKGRINVFELFIDQLPQVNKKSKNKPFVKSDFQIVNRDFAFIFDKAIKISDIIKLVKNSDQELINEVNIFDIFEGDNISKEKKSIAFNVEIVPKLKTLTTEEIDEISKKIIESISDKLNGILRS